MTHAAILNAETSDDIAQAMNTILAQDWQLALDDSCTEDWTQHWFLDGKKASIYHNDKGMEFQCGPVFGEDASHGVLWTKESYEGDLRIEYEYTRLDNATRAVNILYVQPTGSGEGEYAKDISKWNHLRKVPSMRHYFDNMNVFHISYAAYGFDTNDPEDDYIRARRYMPHDKGLGGTDLTPDYFRTGLFKEGVPHKIVVIKRGNDLYMHVKNAEKDFYSHWNNGELPPITEGRVGLRQMFTRAARYKDFKIYRLSE